MFLFTIPAVLWIDQFGRKPVLITGAIGMGISHIIVAALYGSFNNKWKQHSAAGWVAVVFVWIYECNFGYSWGVRPYPGHLFTHLLTEIFSPVHGSSSLKSSPSEFEQREFLLELRRIGSIISRYAPNTYSRQSMPDANRNRSAKRPP